MGIVYDRKANAVLVEFFDEVECRLVSRRICKPREVNGKLADAYVTTCGNIHKGGLQYLAQDELLAAKLFLNAIMCEVKLARQYRFRLSHCHSHFVANAADYLPDLPAKLEQRFMKFMASSPSADEILFSGIVRQAAASLETKLVMAVIDRELRRQGVDRKLTIIQQSQVKLRSNIPSPVSLKHKYIVG